MITRYISAVFLAVASTLAIAAASAQSPPGQSSPAQGQAGASAQASGQGAVGVDPSGAKAQDNASSSAAAHAGDNSAALAGDSSVNAVLTKPVDSRRSKPGDPVNARTTQPTRTEDGRSIPKGSTLVGHVSEAHARAEGQADSAVGIVFDKAVTRDGHEIPLRNVGIRAVAAAEGAASGGVGDSGMMTGSGGGMAGGRTGSGGLVGRASRMPRNRRAPRDPRRISGSRVAPPLSPVADVFHVEHVGDGASFPPKAPGERTPGLRWQIQALP